MERFESAWKKKRLERHSQKKKDGCIDGSTLLHKKLNKKVLFRQVQFYVNKLFRKLRVADHNLSMNTHRIVRLFGMLFF